MSSDLRSRGVTLVPSRRGHPEGGRRAGELSCHPESLPVSWTLGCFTPTDPRSYTGPRERIRTLAPRQLLGEGEGTRDPKQAFSRDRVSRTTVTKVTAIAPLMLR